MPTPEEQLSKQWSEAWNSLAPIRATWTEKEQSLLAQANDSFSGNVTYARVTDAALSTLAFERQARVAAQLPTGRVIPVSVGDAGKAKLLNVLLNRYIIPNADAQFPMLVKLRLWGVYASVYGSMPMMYDYRVDDRYIGPECYLVDPRCFAIQPGFSSVQDAEYAFVSTIVGHGFIEGIQKRKGTTYNKSALSKVLAEAKANDAVPSRDADAQKNSQPIDARYDKSQLKGRIEFVTKYESGDGGHWITFAPDFDNTIVRDIPNPHKSGRIPVVMRDCFPLMNSIFGLGDYERGMRIQKAKDSLTNLFLEGAKNRIFPPLKINTQQVTLSTIKNQANARWFVSNMAGAEPVQYGNQPLGEFQAAWGALQSMLMNQFGTTDTSVSQQDTGNPAFGKTPQALQQLQQRQNSRDTWDMFMHEQATQELFEGMLNLLTVKMEKPITISLFEEDIRQLGEQFKDEKDLKTFDGGKGGAMVVSKKQIQSSHPYTYLIDPNSSMSENAQEQFVALKEVWDLVNANPYLPYQLMTQGYTYDRAQHLKSLFVAAGVSDWDKILQEQSQNQKSPEDQAKEQQMQQQMMMFQHKPPIERINYADAPPDVQAQMEQSAGLQPSQLHGMQMQQEAQAIQQGEPQGKPPLEQINYKDAPPDIKAQMEHAAGMQPSQTHQGELAATGAQQAVRVGAAAGMAQTTPPPAPGPGPQQPDFHDPEIAAMAQHLMGGGR